MAADCVATTGLLRASAGGIQAALPARYGRTQASPSAYHPARCRRQQIDLRGVGRIALLSAGVRVRNLLSRSSAH